MKGSKLKSGGITDYERSSCEAVNVVLIKG